MSDPEKVLILPASSEVNEYDHEQYAGTYYFPDGVKVGIFQLGDRDEQLPSVWYVEDGVTLERPRHKPYVNLLDALVHEYYLAIGMRSDPEFVRFKHMSIFAKIIEKELV